MHYQISADVQFVHFNDLNDLVVVYDLVLASTRRKNISLFSGNAFLSVYLNVSYILTNVFLFMCDQQLYGTKN